MVFSLLILTKACFVMSPIVICCLCALLKCINNVTNPICERNIQCAFFREERSRTRRDRVFDFFRTRRS